MTGETAQAQPGGRTPAPGPLALVQAFLNTHYDLEVDHGAEVWPSPEAYARWLARHGLLAATITVDGADLPPALMATLKHAASMPNPIFYERQRRRAATWDTPRSSKASTKPSPETSSWRKPPPMPD